MLKSTLTEQIPAKLVLADGSVFSGIAIGALGQAVGEVVFNTAMTGYQEILTDPSYAEQIVTLTYPHIGNVGVNRQDAESDRIWAKGLIIRELSPIVSNWRSEQSLSDYLKEHNIVAIAGVDTRRLTRILREQGAQSGCIITAAADRTESDDALNEAGLKAATAYPGLIGKDLAKEVTTSVQKQWVKGTYNLEGPATSTAPQHKVVVYDFGVKQQILRLLVDHGCELTIVPATTPAEDVIAMQPDGVFLSNGPGDPAACDYAIANIKALLDADLPIFGICLGCQLLALACGAGTQKMKFGHHGANHPVQDLHTQQVMITSQNHGFCINEQQLPSDLSITHRSLFDGSIQGIAHKTKPAFAFQGHPEASPGPHDIRSLFATFTKMIKTQHCIET